MATTKTKTDKNTGAQTSRWLALGLTMLALVAIFTRVLTLGGAPLAGGDQIWRLTIDVSVKSRAQATAIQIYPPLETKRLRIIQRNLHHPGFRLRNWSEDKDERRSIVAFASSSGTRSVISEFFIHSLGGTPLATEEKQGALSNTEREKFLRDTAQLQIDHPLVKQTTHKLTNAQTDRLKQIDEIVNHLQLFKLELKKDELNVPLILETRRASVLDRALGMVALCRTHGIPARIVAGLILKEDIDPQTHYWVEVYANDSWLSYDIGAGYRGSVPANYLPLRRDGYDIVQILNGELLQLNYDLDREFSHPYLHQFKTRNLFNIFELDRLPMESRNELALLMLLPLGVLITALCRHLVGIHSYGVFTPTLLALAMVYTDIVTTIVIFFVISSLAISGRSLFPTSLTRIPRLAIIFTLVALLLTFSASVMEYYDLGQGGRVVLLPIIILTSLVDRLYRTMEDKGVNIAMHRLIWTLIITLLCLPIIQFEELGHLIVRYPEGHLMTLALFLLIASYKGRQLINLPFIKWLAEPESKKTKTVDE